MTEAATGEKPALRLHALAEAAGTKRRGRAPVESWNPPFCGDIDMRIAADGTWYYAGTPILRPALVSLFAGILRKDPERYVLVTPVERVGIVVDDTPFIAVTMEKRGDTLRFTTNLGDTVDAGPEHPLRFETGEAAGVKPYVHVRGGLWARLTRAIALDLLEAVESAAVDGIETMGVRSSGCFFAIAPVDAAP
jgi:uncharacterized protein